MGGTLYIIIIIVIIVIVIIIIIVYGTAITTVIARVYSVYLMSAGQRQVVADPQTKLGF